MHHRWYHRDDPRHEDHGARDLEEPVFTTLAVGEEGDDVEPDDGFATTAAIGEEGNPGFEEPVATTAALGEEGDPDHDFWSA